MKIINKILLQKNIKIKGTQKESIKKKKIVFGCPKSLQFTVLPVLDTRVAYISLWAACNALLAYFMFFKTSAFV